MEILFGRGFGTHSLGLKSLINKFYNEEYTYKKHFFYEQHIITILYDIGFFGLIFYLLCFILLEIFFIKKIKKINCKKSMKNFIIFIPIIPIILINTGYQFSKDYIFQFFYFFLIGLIILYIYKDKDKDKIILNKNLL